MGSTWHVFRKYLAIWFGMPFLGILNGIIREAGYGRWMNELSAHQLSTLTGILIMTAYVWFFYRKWRIANARQALGIGAAWLALTILFEFGFGHYLVGHPWERLLHDYNLAAGRVWSIFLLWMTLLPYLLYRFKR